MASGLVFIHHVPSGLISHVEWTLAGVCGQSPEISWTFSKEANFGTASFEGSDEAGSILASAFMNLKQLVFEVIQYPNGPESGHRWSFTPELGMFHSATDAAGNLLFGENQIRVAMERGGQNPLRLQAELRRLLGQAWDDELEQYRERELVMRAEGNDGIVSTEAKRVANGQNIRPL